MPTSKAPKAEQDAFWDLMAEGIARQFGIDAYEGCSDDAEKGRVYAERVKDCVAVLQRGGWTR
jgi:hypothetical protein